VLEGNLVLGELLELEFLAVEDYLVDVDLALVEADGVDEEVLLAEILLNFLVLERFAESSSREYPDVDDESTGNVLLGELSQRFDEYLLGLLYRGFTAELENGNLRSELLDALRDIGFLALLS